MNSTFAAHARQRALWASSALTMAAVILTACGPGGITDAGTIMDGVPPATASTGEEAIESSITPYPTETSTPTESPQTPEDVIFQVAEFSGNAEVISTNGKLTINYSDAVLAKRSIESISMDPEILDKIHDLIIRNTYDKAGESTGSEIRLKPPGGRSISGVVDTIYQYTVTYEEFPEIQKLLYEGGFEFADYEFTSLSKALLFFAEDGSLVIVYHSYMLRTPSSDWDRKNVDFVVIADGPGSGFANITTTAIYGNLNLTNRRTLLADPIYHLFGCYESNSWCQVNGSEGIDVTFRD